MRGFIACLMALFLTGCCCPVYEGIPIGEELTMSTREISQAVLIFADKWNDEHIYLNNSWAYKAEDGRDIVWMDFHTQKLADVDAARRIMVYMVEGFLDQIHQSYEGVYYTHENLYISIEFESFHGRYVDPLYVGRMELMDGVVTASYAHTALDRRSVVFHQHFEPYESSLFFIQVEDQIAAEKPEKIEPEAFMYDIPTEGMTAPKNNLSPPKAPRPNYSKPSKPQSSAPKRPGWVE